MKFSRQKYWSGLPFPSSEDLPNPGIEPGSFALQADSLLSINYVSEKLKNNILTLAMAFVVGDKHSVFYQHP